VATVPFQTDPVALEDIVRSVLAAPEFAGNAVLRSLTDRCALVSHYAVAIPACNEEVYLPRCLTALTAAMGSARHAGCVIFVVHDSDDRSTAIAAQWLGETGLSGAVVDLSLAPHLRNAPGARRLALDIAARVACRGVLLTTDADTAVGAAWVLDMLAAIDDGADLVCEDVQLDPGELALLPRSVRDVGEIERSYFAALEQLWARWTNERFGPFAIRASGASMALRTAAYEAVGGSPLIDKGEDRALCEKVRAAGFSAVSIGTGQTVTSARLKGRALGGCGDALASRAREADPRCDERLVRVDELRIAARHSTMAGRRLDPKPRLRGLRCSEVAQQLSIAHDLLARTNGA
jgi:glycosyltransferase involved in cell wall biosynthesis